MFTAKTNKKFNVTGLCNPDKHYMVDTSMRINRIIEEYIAQGEYFTINRARQYGKTTTLALIERRLADDCIVLDMSFEGSDPWFESFGAFCYNFRLYVRTQLLYKNETALAQVWDERIDENAPDQYYEEKSRKCAQLPKSLFCY